MHMYFICSCSGEDREQNIFNPIKKYSLFTENWGDEICKQTPVKRLHLVNMAAQYTGESQWIFANYSIK